MTDTTTIQITTEQRDKLQARKTYDDEPIKAVIGRLLENEEAARPGPDADIAGEVRELRRAISNDTEVDYAEIERRCEQAVESTLEARRR